MAERSNRFNATQEAVQETALRVSQQQLLDAQLLELGDDDLLQRVEDELNENGALEEGRDEEDDEFPSDDQSDLSDKEREEDLSYYYDDEELPVYTPGGGDNEQAEIPVGDTRSFVDDLRAQVPEHGIADEKQAELVDYLSVLLKRDLLPVLQMILSRVALIHMLITIRKLQGSILSLAI